MSERFIFKIVILVMAVIIKHPIIVSLLAIATWFFLKDFKEYEKNKTIKDKADD